MTWDGANNRIVLTDGAAYQEVGGEMTSSASAAIKNVSESDSTIVLDGKTLSLTGYRINGNNYYKIRDVGSALGFSVDFDPETEIVLIGSANAGQDDTQDDPQGRNPDHQRGKLYVQRLRLGPQRGYEPVGRIRHGAAGLRV